MRMDRRDVICREDDCKMLPRSLKRCCNSPFQRRSVVVVTVVVFLVFISTGLGSFNLFNGYVDKSTMGATSKVIDVRNMKKVPLDNSIDALDTLHHEQSLPGVVLLKDKNHDRHTQIPYNHMIQTSLLYSFSSEPRHASDMFADTPAENDYFMICPALRWHRGHIVTVSRLWINYEGRQVPKPKNEWYDNYLYAKVFHKNLTMVEPGSLLGIPAIQQYHFGTGQLDPRMFEVNNTLYVNFHMKYPPHDAYERTYLWDFDNHKLYMPWYDMYDQNDSDQPDKNWSSLVIRGILYYIHWINPLTVMKCDQLVKCQIIYKEPFSPKLKYGLRGGTPFELYKWPYYIAVTHSVVKTKNNNRLYYAHISVISVEPWELVYTTDPIEVHDDILKSCPVIRNWVIDAPFIYPTGLIIEDPNTVAVGIHANDCRSFIIRIKGIHNMLRDVLREHKAYGN